MLLTAAALLVLLAALLSGLRNGFYVLHILAVCLGIFLYQHVTGKDAPLFSVGALWIFFAFHLASINILTFAAYGYDKAAARAGRWRMKEKSLHAMTFAGGTFGAYAGQKFFRHKTRKHSFRAVFWITTWFQLVLAYVFWVMSR